MFEAGNWTHQDFMDVFIEVLHVQYRGPKYYKLKVIFWNRSQTGKPWPITSKQTITVDKCDFNKWSRYDT